MPVIIDLCNKYMCPHLTPSDVLLLLNLHFVWWPDSRKEELERDCHFFLAELACIAWDYTPLNTKGPHLIIQSGAN